ncbi:hypothetical protein [Deinococcus roseus]|uniref:Lipoprotein n=1 Tax=Deinococcus roseus TaxID=392414 RepID=A0ABQ2DE76_9DEIO|nr:hypothetical protein [Deinococcus roseus]GGJ54614.1 hypothetical protein GCM10008938_45880 [Deinococcus roseus]
MRRIFNVLLTAGGLATVLMGCAPVLINAPTTVQGNQERQYTYQTLEFTGKGSGTFTSADYRMVLVLRQEDLQVRGVFYNISGNNNYDVSGYALRTSGKLDFNLTLSQGAGAGTSYQSKAEVLGNEFRLFGAGWSAGTTVKAQLIGTLTDHTFEGKLKVILSNYSVIMHLQD